MTLSLSLLIAVMISNAQENPSQKINVEFVEFDLDNGLHVIMHKDSKLPIATINVWYHVGSKNEHEGRTGFAHLFEHMMFQGSANIPDDGHFKYVQQAGGTLNGSTSFDRTNYFETIPSNQLELGLWLEADRMMSLAVTQKNLDNQREVVKEERRTRTDNVPYGTMSEILFRNAYKVQSYKWSVIGSMADLNAASLEDVKAFHSMYYVPNNASLCVAGDIDYEKTKALVKKYFSDIPKGDKQIYRPTVVEPDQPAQVRDYIYDNVRLPAMSLAFHIPEQDHPDFYALDVLANVMSSGRSSRLYQRLVYKDRIAQSSFCSANGLEQPGLFIFRATAQMGKKLETIENTIWEEIKKVQDELVNENELQKAKNRQETGFIIRLMTSQSKADQLNSYYIFSQKDGVSKKDAVNINTELKRILMITRDDIQRVAKKYFAKENSTVLYCLPKPKASKGEK